ncbi:hypothetical protein FB45DRAFT_868761 [Roridomyces roridus]|uniref:Uncharacterized protein n=1 Tax=Roridomyces roridus TaxID=1738132 RepID=A0AAD7FI91_9AGAR|nr:hypothetical protein FB45DRAFT_868761 [Roridomyces roridus]
MFYTLDNFRATKFRYKVRMISSSWTSSHPKMESYVLLRIKSRDHRHWTKRENAAKCTTPVVIFDGDLINGRKAVQNVKKVLRVEVECVVALVSTTRGGSECFSVIGCEVSAPPGERKCADSGYRARMSAASRIGQGLDRRERRGGSQAGLAKTHPLVGHQSLPSPSTVTFNILDVKELKAFGPTFHVDWSDIYPSMVADSERFFERTLPKRGRYISGPATDSELNSTFAAISGQITGGGRAEIGP